MTLHELLLLALCGLGTFLLRYVPLRVLSWQSGQRKTAPEFLLRMLQGVGPAAIAALWLVSFMPMLDTQQPPQFLAAVIAATAVYGVKRATGSLALSILLSAVIYGVIMQLSLSIN